MSRLYAVAARVQEAIGRLPDRPELFAELPDAHQDHELALLTDAVGELSSVLDKTANQHKPHQESGTDSEPTTEQELRFVASLHEVIPGILYLYDQHARLLRWNRNLELATGYSAAEVTRLHPLDFFLPDDRARVQQAITAVFEKGESRVEASLTARDGSSAPYLLTGRRVLFDGKPCAVGVGIDISERKRAEEALRKLERRYRTTLDSTLEGCQLIGFDWRYLYLNDAAAVHNRRPNAEILGLRMPDVWPGIEATEVFAMLARCMETRVAEHRETEFAFPDGTAGWFDVRVQAVPEGIFVLSIDISERQRAERALRELNDSLELKVTERTAALEAATRQAESADRIKSAFLATMSHELRTPLNSIIGFTGIVLQGLAGPLHDEQKKQLGMVQGSARHLLALINDVLDISKIEAGQLQVHCAAFDLQSCITGVVDSVRPQADKKELSLHTVLPPAFRPMVSDRRRVEQILLNLLNNAIKFTDRGRVTLTVTLEETAPAPESAVPETWPVVRLQVADTGIGMKREDLANLFQPFRQIDSGLTRQHEGTGLGLAICRRLTGLLGGTIGVDSQLGAGSIFTVVLPLDQRTAPAPALGTS